MKKLSPPSIERFREATMPPAILVSRVSPGDMETIAPASTRIASLGPNVTTVRE
jgi:hypothetical protein